MALVSYRKPLVLALLAFAPIAGAQEKTDTRPPLAEVLITGQYIDDVVAAKSDVPLLETPQAISVVTADTLKDLGISRLAEALRTVAGISRSSTYGYYDAYQIRGYDAAYGSVYLDGLLSANVAGANNELAGLEQIEVIKGPASMLFGSAPLGGIVNLVSKRPRAERSFETALATGSYGLFEATLDANTPLLDSGALLGRLNLVYRDSDDFVRNSEQERIFVAPAVTWNIASGTSLTFLSRYERNRDSPWSPTSAWGTVLPSANGPLPIDFTINADLDSSERAIHNQDHKQIGYVFNHSFNDAISFDQTLRYTHRKVFWNNWNFAGGFVDSDIVDGVQQGTVMGRNIYGPFRETDKDFAVDSRASFKLGTASIRHNLVFGVDYRRNRNVFADEGGNFDPGSNPLDLLDPDYSSPLVHDPEAAYSGEGKSRQTGFYVQDHIRLGERLTLTLGGRWDTVDTDDVKDEKFSPRIGGTWQVIPGAAFYASWSKSFTPQPGYFTFEGEPLTPETGTNVEAGFKIATPDGRLSGMISLFELTRQNVATDDPEHLFFYIVTGEQRSRGFEMEGTWRPAPAVTLSLAYAYLDAEVTKDNLFLVGAPLANVPKHGINLLGEYVVPEGPLAKLGLHAAFLYNSRKNATLYPEDLDGDGESDPLSLFTLPSYSIVDAGVSYPLGSVQLRLNVNNLFDERYFPDACCVDRVTPGEPRNWQVAVSKSF